MAQNAVKGSVDLVDSVSWRDKCTADVLVSKGIEQAGQDSLPLRQLWLLFYIRADATSVRLLKPPSFSTVMDCCALALELMALTEPWDVVVFLDMYSRFPICFAIRVTEFLVFISSC